MDLASLLFAAMALLAQEPWESTDDGLWTFPDGRYVERQPDGSPGCGVDGARAFRWRVRVEESLSDGATGNGGAFILEFDDEPVRYELREVISMADPSVAFDGRSMTVAKGGLLIEGGLDSHVSGDLDLIFLIRDDDAVELVSAYFRGGSGRGNATIVDQHNEPRVAGFLPDGTPLRPFTRCGE
ncbi:hypothetical protein [Marinicauda salina]|nr:hypothetical protein [Marinicauda salina]